MVARNDASACKPSTDLSHIRRQAINERPGIKASRVLTCVDRVGDDVAHELRHG